MDDLEAMVMGMEGKVDMGDMGGGRGSRKKQTSSDEAMRK